MPFLIRPATSADIGTIAEFNRVMALETEQITLDMDRHRAGVKSLLERPEYGFYLMAECDGEVAGQIMITYEWSDWRNGAIWWIQSVFVRPEFRRQKVFSALFEEIHRRARDSAACGIRLYVERDNQVAMKVYEAQGMVRAPYAVYEIDFVIHRPHEAE